MSLHTDPIKPLTPPRELITPVEILEVIREAGMCTQMHLWVKCENCPLLVKNEYPIEDACMGTSGLGLAGTADMLLTQMKFALIT